MTKSDPTYFLPSPEIVIIISTAKHTSLPLKDNHLEVILGKSHGRVCLMQDNYMAPSVYKTDRVIKRKWDKEFQNLPDEIRETYAKVSLDSKVVSLIPTRLP